MCAGVPCMSPGQKLEPGTRTRTNFAMLGPAEKRVCKRRISVTFSGTRTIFIRTVPRIFGSVNGALVSDLQLFCMFHSHSSSYNRCYARVRFNSCSEINHLFLKICIIIFFFYRVKHSPHTLNRLHFENIHSPSSIGSIELGLSKNLKMASVHSKLLSPSRDRAKTRHGGSSRLKPQFKTLKNLREVGIYGEE